MVWEIPCRQCPSCGHQERVLLLERSEGMYRLSCGWCAFLSDPMTPVQAIFKAWGGVDRGYAVGDVLDLEPVSAYQHNDSGPIRAMLGRSTALVALRR